MLQNHYRRLIWFRAVHYHSELMRPLTLKYVCYLYLRMRKDKWERRFSCNYGDKSYLTLRWRGTAGWFNRWLLPRWSGRFGILTLRVVWLILHFPNSNENKKIGSAMMISHILLEGVAGEPLAAAIACVAFRGLLPVFCCCWFNPNCNSWAAWRAELCFSNTSVW